MASETPTRKRKALAVASAKRAQNPEVDSMG
jgi:hypothetical protein